MGAENFQLTAMSKIDIVATDLPYAGSLDRRDPGAIDLVVIHCTELPDLVTAREYGEMIHYPTSGTGNSGHFYIDRGGRVEQWVPTECIAHHVHGFNQQSIGIELVNLGRYPHWLNSNTQQMSEHYTPQQIDSLVSLLGFLCSALPQLQWICGHEHLDHERVPAADNPAVQVRRKLDPGPLFPWKELLKSPSLSDKLRRYRG